MRYRDDGRCVPAYDHEQDVQVVKLIKRGDRSALDFFVTNHLFLAERGASRALVLRPNCLPQAKLEWDDLIQEGAIALLRALKKVDLRRLRGPHGPRRLHAYLGAWVEGGILRFVDRELDRAMQQQEREISQSVIWVIEEEIALMRDGCVQSARRIRAISWEDRLRG